MGHTITIADEALGGAAREGITLEFLTDEITVRELIRERVYQEVKDHNAKPKVVFQGLVQPTETEPTPGGYRVAPGRMIDWEPQFEKAIAAYESSGFLVLVEDRQTETLEERLTIGPRTSVTFLKLTPLVGG